jgi:Amt family ammonium transporter
VRVNRARRYRRPTPLIPFHFPTSTLAYFQFVFAAITPLLFMGSVLGRIKFSAWCLLVPLWSTCVYSVDAFLLWGGGYFAQEGALDFSGGYVIHMSAGVSGFVAAWVLGPRLLRDRQHALPNNLVMAAVGAGILWLGWNGFNGGDPYYAGADGRRRGQHQPGHRRRRGDLDGPGRLALQGEEAHLPGWRERHDLRTGRDHTLRRLGQRLGRHRRRCDLHAIVWIAWNYLSKVRPFSKVDDALGVIYTHGIAGLFGGLLLGIFGDPNMIEYGCGQLNSAGQVVAPRPTAYVTAKGSCTPFGVGGLMYTGSAHQLWEQFRAADLRHLLVGAGDLHPDEAHRAGPRRRPLQGRDPRGRRPGHPRRGGVPGGDTGRAGRGLRHGRRLRILILEETG